MTTENDSLSFVFARLQLASTADRASIRRAYARELKLLDPQQDAADFQLLRECYEYALQWGALQDPGSAAPLLREESKGAARADAEVHPVDTHAAAAQVFERFMQIRTRLVEPGQLNDVKRWEAEIKQRLADEELINLNVGLLFEGLIAHALANDYQEGQYAFFLAATALFDWECDRQRLLKFGADGALIDETIEQRHIFRAQHERDKAAQRGVFDRMRRVAAPSADELFDDIVIFETIFARFPQLVAMRAPAWKIAQWLGGCRALRLAHGDGAFNVRLWYEPALAISEGTQILLGLLLLLLIAGSFFI